MSVIPQKVQDAINEQIKNELYSAYIYLAMSAHFESESLTGFASWMRVQAREEVTHGMKLFDYLTDRGGTVALKAIQAPPSKFDSPLGIFQTALKHEQEVTAMIHGLYALAAQENDYPTQVALNWFVTEQVEEEKTAAEIVAQLEMVADNRTALLLLDREMAGRGKAAAGAGA
jgi:ferritin